MEIGARQCVTCRKIRMLAALVAAVIVTGPHLARSQNQPSSAVRPWQKSRTSGVKGTHIQTPTSILKELKMNPDECPDLSPGAPTKMDAYRVQRNARTIAPVHGGGFCFCGATGNCAFWIYRFHQGK